MKDKLKDRLLFVVQTLCLVFVLFFTLCEVKPNITLSYNYYAIGLCTLGLCAIILLLYNKTNLRYNSLDALMSILGIYITINYFFVSTVPAEVQTIQTISMFALYFMLRVFISLDRRVKYILFLLLMICGVYEATLGLRQVTLQSILLQWESIYQESSLLKITPS